MLKSIKIIWLYRGTFTIISYYVQLNSLTIFVVINGNVLTLTLSN